MGVLSKDFIFRKFSSFK